MATIGNIKGALLEEIVLWLLEKSGYSIIDSSHVDGRLLKVVSAGLSLRGRGEWHQIDAIAEYKFQAPFAYKQRLLVEAKCYSDVVGLDVTRNSVGVLKDLFEYFVPEHDGNGVYKARYHYQSALISINGFSKPAQNYSYAQDIFLLDLGSSSFKPIVRVLNKLSRRDFAADIKLKDLREAFRKFLRGGNYEDSQTTSNKLLPARNHLHVIGFLCVAMIGGVLPVFLIPDSSGVFQYLIRQGDEIECRIFIDSFDFFIESSRDSAGLFNFKIPPELFKLCFDNGVFDQLGAANAKEKYLNDIEITLYEGNKAIKKKLVLDLGWLQRIRNKIRENEDVE